jgi:hypothetical protein
MMVGFDPDALARLLRRWKACAADAECRPAAEAWTLARHELSLVIAVSPQAPGAVSKSTAVDPRAEVQGRRSTRDERLF